MIIDEATQAAVEAFLKDDRSYCECRHSPLDKHDVNPPCSTRKRVTAQMGRALEAALPYLSAAAWDEGQRAWEDELLGKAPGTNPYRSGQ